MSILILRAGFRMLLKHTPSRSKAISLTPLIDVVFILLLFFMLSSSFSRWFALDVSMPQAAKQELAESTRIRILNNTGSLAFEDKVFERVDQVLINLLKQDAGSVILLDAENRVSTQAIVSLLERLNAEGLANVSLGNTFDQHAIN